MDKKIVDKIARRIVSSYHDIDIDVYYDGFDARHLYDDVFTELAEVNLTGNVRSLLLYGDSSQSDPKDLLELWDSEKYIDTFSSDGIVYESSILIFDYTPEEIADFVKSHCTLDEVNAFCLSEYEDWNEDYTDDFVDWDDYREWIAENYDRVFDFMPENVADELRYKTLEKMEFPSWESILSSVNFFRNEDFTDVGLHLKKGYDYHISRGYNQGDAAVVIYGKGANTDIIDHILWDAPVHCVIDIDGDSFDVGSEMKDAYVYDRDEVISIMKKLLGDKYDDGIDKYLKSHLPDELKYVG